MAATDKHYYHQYTLDVVFGITSILLFASTVWMFVADHWRPFKAEQKFFRQVETAVAQRLALDQLPSQDEFKQAKDAVANARQKREEREKQLQENRAKAEKDLPLSQLPEGDIRAKLNREQPLKEMAEQQYQMVKADLESRVSFYNIEIEHHGKDSPTAARYLDDINRLTKELDAAKKKRDTHADNLLAWQKELIDREGETNTAISALKKLTDRFETQVRVAAKKRWSLSDSLRGLPVVDAFAAPVKIQQFTINDVPIDYNFKYVTRFDRCMTCHQGIDRPSFTKEMLTSLRTPETDKQKQAHAGLDKKLTEARAILQEHKDSLAFRHTDAASVPTPSDLALWEMSADQLTDSRVRQFCAHPRLDLFVAPNSKHPAEKFGCTSCHSGQGSATSFTLASHTPDNYDAKKRWQKDHGWESIHMWDFPMFPQRFVEASCVKCHHQITDLITSENRNEAPKLLRGYGLVKENGCFGCHEIHGKKGGVPIGPDMRLEPYPPLEEVTPTERAKLEGDPDNPPGNMRKVGPSLFRLSEKTHAAWVARWLRSPRGFRPDTKMPHYYDLANNHPNVLPADQKDFPDAEIQAIVHYLFHASKDYLAKVDQVYKQEPDPIKRALAQEKDQNQLLAIHKELENLKSKDKLTKEEEDRRDQLLKDTKVLSERVRLRQVQPLHDLTAGYDGNADKGRQLFTERGCLACHVHQGTTNAQGTPGQGTYSPALVSEALFGPNLSQLQAKLVRDINNKADKDQARRWLVQWIVNPQIHNPRTRMPITHLTPTEAADIAAWLLAQPPRDLGLEWDQVQVADGDTLQKKNAFRRLAEVYLVRLLPREMIDEMFQKGELPEHLRSDLPLEEKELAKKVDEDRLKVYLGKKAFGRLGCFGCHDIPGFENAKPIGVGLNDWGKRDPGRLAFEDINNFAKNHYHIVDSLKDKEGKPAPLVTEGGQTKLPYEKFFYEALKHHTREGFLFQKLLEPRSYDYNRLRAWDDLLRMPQFRFGRARQRQGETTEQFLARANVEEAEAREAVMTFILGLVAEPVPTKSINQPRGDRLAEVKGRQILDKYNCGGCHLIRSGPMELRVNGDSVPKQLTTTYDIIKGGTGMVGDHVFVNHHNWVGAYPANPERLTTHAARPRLMTIADRDDPSIEYKVLKFYLTHSLRFKDNDKGLFDIRAGQTLKVKIEDFAYPAPEVLTSEEKFKAFQRDQGAYGGQFADLLAQYLMAKDKTLYKPKEDFDDSKLLDSGEARAASPPPLINQGERTQADWLYQFLLDPQIVRRMTVLRMPRFNMSKEEAQALVDYFAAVTKLTNPGIGLNHPHEDMTHYQDADNPYWKRQTSEYVARMKKETIKDGPDKGKTYYAKRLEELRPVWQQVRKDLERQRDEAKIRFDQAETAWKNAKEDKQLEAARNAWEAEFTRLKDLVNNNSEEKQQGTWENREAYITDGYRLLANKENCLLCHNIGGLPTDQKTTPGPNLDLAQKRLRPDWTQRWIAHPQRFLTYESIMPAYFPLGEDKGQQYFAGTSFDRLTAVRDILMIFQRAEVMPVNRQWALPVLGDKK